MIATTVKRIPANHDFTPCKIGFDFHNCKPKIGYFECIHCRKKFDAQGKLLNEAHSQRD